MSRIEKINDLIKDEVSKCLVRYHKDEVGFVTVIKADVTKDLKRADIWVSIIDEEQDEKFKSLEKKDYEIQKWIAEKVKLRNIPKIYLHHDKTGEYSFKIDKIIRDLKKDDGKK